MRDGIEPTFSSKSVPFIYSLPVIYAPDDAPVFLSLWCTAMFTTRPPDPRHCHLFICSSLSSTRTRRGGGVSIYKYVICSDPAYRYCCARTHRIDLIHSTDSRTYGTPNGTEAGMVLSTSTPTHADTAFGTSSAGNDPRNKRSSKNHSIRVVNNNGPLCSVIMPAISTLDSSLNSVRNQCRRTLLTIALEPWSNCQ